MVQTRVVRVRPRAAADASAPRVTFGFGFERRSQSRQNAPLKQPVPEAQQAPVVTVSQEQPANTDR